MVEILCREIGVRKLFQLTHSFKKLIFIFPKKMSKRKVIQKSITEYTETGNEDQPDKKKLKLTKQYKNEGEKKEDDKKEKFRTNRTETDFSKIDLNCIRNAPNGNAWNFKISSWNIVSLKSITSKNGMEYVKRESPDVMCFQETKCSESKTPAEAKLSEYHRYFVSSQKEGYAGVALYSKTKPLKVQFGIGDKEHDAEGRVILAEYEKFYIVAAYVPNSGRKLVTLPKRMGWDKLFQNFLVELDSQKPVILCGDLNVAHNRIDLKNPDSNTRSAGFTVEERENFTSLLDKGFVDTYRHLYPDKEGAYTYWSYLGNARSRNAGWRLDYFVISKRLMDAVCDSVIRSDVYGSDHCPITLLLSI